MNIIEEAAKAIYEAGVKRDFGDADWWEIEQAELEARAALAVFEDHLSHTRTVNVDRAEWERLKEFEQAHTPTCSAHGNPNCDADICEDTPTDDEREAQGWREAEAYADDSEPSKRAETADDFMAGWRTADRLRRTVQGEALCLTEHPITGYRCSQPAEPNHAHVCDLPAEPQGEPTEHFHIWSDLPCKAGECRMESQGEPTGADAVLSELVIRLNNEAYGKDDATWGQVMRRIEGVEMARAALRAAAVREEEQGHG